jgi:apolipoprotein N-acyltransferase
VGSALRLLRTGGREGSIIRAVLVFLSAALLIASFPPFSFRWSAWFAFVPLLLALRGLTPLQAAMAGGAWSLLANAGIFEWMTEASGFRWYHFIALDTVYSLLPTLWCGLVARLGTYRLRDLFAAAALWVLAEFARTHAGFLALPLATLAHSQLDNPAVVQIAALLGEPAVSFAVILANLVVFHALSFGYSRRLVCTALCLAVALVTGAWFAQGAATSAGGMSSVAALDTHYVVRGAHKLTSEARAKEMMQYLSGHPPDSALSVLPESAFVNPRTEDLLALRALANAYHGTLVVGVSGAAKFEQRVPPEQRSIPDLRVSNTAWIFTAGGTAERYVKAVRMPFGEYLPMSSWISWPHWLVGYPPEVVAGPGPRTYVVGNDLHIGMMICWEALVASHARALEKQGATVLVVIANDGWFGSQGAAALQGLAARMRAVETRRPLVLAANEGSSMVVDRFGRVVAQAGRHTASQWLRANVVLDTVQTPYTRYGDLFVVLCAAALASMLVAAQRPVILDRARVRSAGRCLS